jgi:hypothetical protein
MYRRKKEIYTYIWMEVEHMEDQNIGYPYNKS